MVGLVTIRTRISYVTNAAARPLMQWGWDY